MELIVKLKSTLPIEQEWVRKGVSLDGDGLLYSRKSVKLTFARLRITTIFCLYSPVKKLQSCFKGYSTEVPAEASTII